MCRESPLYILIMAMHRQHGKVTAGRGIGGIRHQMASRVPLNLLPTVATHRVVRRHPVTRSEDHQRRTVEILPAGRDFRRWSPDHKFEARSGSPERLRYRQHLIPRRHRHQTSEQSLSPAWELRAPVWYPQTVGLAAECVPRLLALPESASVSWPSPLGCRSCTDSPRSRPKRLATVALREVCPAYRGYRSDLAGNNGAERCRCGKFRLRLAADQSQNRLHHQDRSRHRTPVWDPHPVVHRPAPSRRHRCNGRAPHLGREHPPAPAVASCGMDKTAAGHSRYGQPEPEPVLRCGSRQFV